MTNERLPEGQELAQRISELEKERDKLRARLAEQQAETAEARREGAEQMREASAVMCRDAAIRLINKAQLIESEEADEAVTMQSQAWKLIVVCGNIRALPLPTGRRQAVRLTDELRDKIAEHVGLLGPNSLVGDAHEAAERFARAIETAVLTANGLESK